MRRIFDVAQKRMRSGEWSGSDQTQHSFLFPQKMRSNKVRLYNLIFMSLSVNEKRNIQDGHPFFPLNYTGPFVTILANMINIHFISQSLHFAVDGYLLPGNDADNTSSAPKSIGFVINFRGVCFCYENTRGGTKREMYFTLTTLSCVSVSSASWIDW